MALLFPPSISINRFTGGYQSTSEYTDLEPTDTNDAENTVYGQNGAIEQRLGSLKLISTKLFSSSATATGRPITGYFQYDKLGNPQTFHVACAGDSIYSVDVSSTSVTAVAASLTDNSETYWSFIQFQDPRSANDFFPWR